jgi:ABC-type transport system involved in multi-copper enzyme maturation permease subunit
VTWVAWRLQRTETLIALGILALLAALLVPTGISMADAYHHDGIGSCLLALKGSACGQKLLSFQQQFHTVISLADWFTLVPGLIGVLFATPFILDLEHGTYRLSWTQSITRGRWLLGKLGLPVLACLITSGALILLLTWWRGPAVHINGRLDTGAYDNEGTVALGYTLFALGLGLAVGAVWRRAAASLAVAFVGYFVVRLFVDLQLRNHLVTPLKATWKGAAQPHFLDNALILQMTAIIRHGSHALGGGVIGGKTQVAAPGLGANATFHATYIPARDFWPLQLHETALFLGVAGILIAFAAWWTHQQRTA